MALKFCPKCGERLNGTSDRCACCEYDIKTRQEITHGVREKENIVKDEAADKDNDRKIRKKKKGLFIGSAAGVVVICCIFLLISGKQQEIVPPMGFYRGITMKEADEVMEELGYSKVGESREYENNLILIYYEVESFGESAVLSLSFKDHIFKEAMLQFVLDIELEDGLTGDEEKLLSEVLDYYYKEYGSPVQADTEKISYKWKIEDGLGVSVWILDQRSRKDIFIINFYPE